MAAGEGVTEGVQAYLGKHKIPSLFENLMSKLVKELPSDPIEFLITKLQTLQKQKRKVVSPHLSPGSRGRLQVSGTAVGSKTVTTTRTSASAERLAKSPRLPTARLKPPSSPAARAKLPSSPTARAKLPSSPTARAKLPTSPTAPTSAARSLRAPSRPSTAGQPARSPGQKATSSIPSAGRSKSTATPTAAESKRPTTAPGGSRGARALPTSIATPTSHGGRERSANATAKGGVAKKPSTSPAKAAAVPTIKTELREAKPRTPTPKPAEEDLDEFFGEARKSSGRQFRSMSDEDEDAYASARPTDGDDETDDEVEDEGAMLTGGGVEDIDLDELLKKRLGSKVSGKKHQASLLLAASGKSPTSSGYMTDEGTGESEEDEEAIVLVEDYAALEEEGVTGLAKGKYTERPKEDESTSFDLKVMICARCATVLNRGEEGSELTEVTAMQSVGASKSDIDSASQVGGHASFPQWDAGSAVESETSVQNWMGSQGTRSTLSHDSGSDVTVQSHDTWGGLAPMTQPTVPISDEESEVHLPPPPPLEGQPWVQEEAVEHDPHGWASRGEEDGDT